MLYYSMAANTLPMSLLTKYGPVNKIATLQNGTRASGSSSSSSVTTPMADFQLPDWLSTDPDSLIDELMSEYSGTGKAFNPAGVARSFDNSINTVMGMGGQMADNAMRESIARSGMEGGGVNSAMVKAQTMLPMFEQASGLRKDKALAVADIRQREAGMRANLAQAIGQMRTSYLSMLAETYMRGRGLATQHQQSQQQFDLQRDESDLRRELALRGTSGGGGGGGGRAPVAPFSGMMTRAPNNSGMGGIEYTPQFLQYMKEAGYDAPPAPQYPRETGISGGPALDGYMSQLRRITSMASGGAVPEYNAEPYDFLASTGSYMGDPNYDPMTGMYKGKPVVRSY